MTMNLSPGIPTPEFPNFDDITRFKSRFTERAPNAQDWNQLISEICAHQAVLATGDYVTPISAVGDGVADDTAALKAAIATGRNVVLDPTKTYTLSGTLYIPSGQTVDGRGATVQPANQKITTCLVQLDSGVTKTFTVSDASEFIVGDTINAFFDQTHYNQQPRKIVEIDYATNTITIDIPFNNYALSDDDFITAGASIYTGFYLISAASGAGFITIRNINFRGNIANQTFGHCVQTGALSIQSNFNLVENCTFEDIHGEAIVAFGGQSTIRRCWFKDISGNAVHFSGGEHCTVENCYGYNCGRDLSIAHNHGFASWSALCSHVVISNCWIEECLCGLAGIQGNDESDVKIINNFFRNNDNGSLSIGATSGSSGSLRCLVSGNWSTEDSATNFSLIGNNMTTGVVQNIVVTNNHLMQSSTASAFAAQAITGVVISNNYMECSYASHAGVVCRLDGVVQVAVTNNCIRLGSIGILVEGTSTIQCKSVNIVGNQCAGQRTLGIRSNKSAAPFDTEINISNNTVFNTPDNTVNGYVGIAATSGCVAQSNVVRIDSNSGAITTTKDIIIAGSPVTGAGCICQLNVVRGNPQYGIQTFGGTGLCVVQYNITTSSAILLNSGGQVVTPASGLAYTGTSSGSLQTGTGLVTVSDGGNYTTAPTVFFLQGANFSAYGAAVLTGTAITGVNIQSGGSGYNSDDPITVIVGGNYVQGNFTIPTTG